MRFKEALQDWGFILLVWLACRIGEDKDGSDSDDLRFGPEDSWTGLFAWGAFVLAVAVFGAAVVSLAYLAEAAGKTIRF